MRLAVDTAGLDYRKWGADQHCKPGDWLVDNQGEVYTVDHESFVSTYRAVSPGRYIKHGVVWAREAKNAGVIETKEGKTRYGQGDFVVYNEREGTDGYAIAAEKFHALYEPDDETPASSSGP